MHRLTPIAMLFVGIHANAAVDLFAGKGSGKVLSSWPTYAECVAAGAKTKKQYTCRTVVEPPVPAPPPAPIVAPPAPSPAPAPTPAPSPAPAPTPAPAPSPAPAPAPSPAPAPAPTTVTAWVRAANSDYTRDPISAPVGSTVRIGDGLKWATATMKAGLQCALDQFGSDGAGMAYTKWCEVQVTAPSVTQIPGAMPVVNKGLVPLPSIVASGPRVMTLSAEALATHQFDLGRPANPPNGDDIGAFRVSVPYSHISNDDPIVYPGKVGAAHTHTFAGNKCANANSTADSLLACTQSTSGGGTLNNTAYWFPTMIDTRTGQPIVPLGANFYYKGGYQSVDPTKIVPFPKGLRMIAGSATNAGPLPDGVPHTGSFRCVGGPNNQNVGGDHIISCDVGAVLWQDVDFPQCWDGTNLDSPDHKSHMAYGVGTKNPDNSPRPNVNGCPVTHPVALPAISLNTIYFVPEKGVGDFWRLSSDMYPWTLPGGYSLHADWFGAWDDATLKAFVTNCINARSDCHNNLLGDGRMLF